MVFYTVDFQSLASCPAMAECANCKMFGWEQAGNVNLRCSRCKVPRYCDKDCQDEHWVKHHKQQCRALAGRKPEPLAGHRGAACPDCQVGVFEGHIFISVRLSGGAERRPPFVDFAAEFQCARVNECD